MNVRNLEQIQETDGDGKSARAATILLASVGGAAIVIAAVMSMRQAAPPEESKADPLAALVAKSKRPEATPPETVRSSEVTFPSILSDSTHPTTALAAVKDERGHLIAPSPDPDPGPAVTPPPADKLPVVPLPAGTLLDRTPVTERPKDPLVALAKDVSQVEAAPAVMPGAEGGYQLQVASFKDQGDADRFVAELLKRGHRAYRQPAYVADRGLWHRVRIGPFKTKFAAAKYREEFDRKERMNAFLVDPDKVKRQEALRQSKLASRAQATEQ